MNINFMQTIKLTNTYIVLATPLILFTLVSNLYFFIVASAKIINLVIGIFLLFLMSGAFIAGWFRMVKDAVAEECNDNPNSILKNFVVGVGEYFLPSLGGIALAFLVFVIFSLLSYYLGIKFIGDPGINPQEFRDAISNTAQLKVFLDSLAPEQIVKFGYWNILLFANVNFYYFVMLLYFPALFYKKKNPLVALFVALKDLFSKKILKTLVLFFIIMLIYLFISFITVIFGGNQIIYFIMTLMNFYFITAVAVGVFNYYYNNFVSTHLGQNVDLTV